MSVSSLYLLPFGNSSNSMASFLLSQPTGCNRETSYILGQAGNFTRTAVARSCLGEVRWRTQNEAVDLFPGLKEPDGNSVEGIWYMH